MGEEPTQVSIDQMCWHKLYSNICIYIYSYGKNNRIYHSDYKKKLIQKDFFHLVFIAIIKEIWKWYLTKQTFLVFVKVKIFDPNIILLVIKIGLQPKYYFFVFLKTMRSFTTFTNFP